MSLPLRLHLICVYSNIRQRPNFYRNLDKVQNSGSNSGTITIVCSRVLRIYNKYATPDKSVQQKWKISVIFCCNFLWDINKLPKSDCLKTLPGGAPRLLVDSKFGHQVAPLALVPKLAIKWQHLQILQICPPGCVTLPWIALLALSVSIELVSSSARVTSVA